MTGTMAMIDAAKIRPQLVLCCPRNRAMPIGSVRLATLLMTVSAQMNSSQLPRNVKIAHVASAGRDNGTASDQKRRHAPAPSIVIASSSSAGSRSKKARSKKVLNANCVPT